MDKRLQNWFNNRCKEHGLDYQSFDLEALIDGTLTYSEQKAEAEKILDRFTSIDMENVREQERQWHKLLEAKAVEERERVEEEFKESIKKVRLSDTSDIKPLQDMQFYIKMILGRYSNGLLVKSRGGLGKSTTVQYAINEVGLNENEYQYYGGHLTKTELYKILYDNRDKIVILDDISNINDAGIISLLKGALWGVGGKRYVEYNSPTTTLKEYPKKFEFTGGVIILTNDTLNANKLSTEALLSRLHVCEVNLTPEDISKMLYNKAVGDGILAVEEAKELVEYIIGYETDVLGFRKTELLNVDFRTLDKAYQIYKFCKDLGEEWKTRLDSLFMVDDKVEAFKQAVEENPESIKEQIRRFVELSGYSRREYYRLKKRAGLSRRYGR